MKKLLAIFAVLFACSFSAHAEETDPLVFEVVSADSREGEWKIDVKNINKGVYVHVIGGWSNVYPNTANLMKVMLKAKGIPIVEKIEDADYGIQSGALASMNFDMIEEKSKAYKFDVLLAQEIAISTLAGITMVGHSGFSADKVGMGDIGFKIGKLPTIGSRSKMKWGESESYDEIVVKFKSNHKPDGEVGIAILNAAVNKFVDAHFTGLPVATAPTQALPASAVVAQ